jgi:hypothetical protein
VCVFIITVPYYCSSILIVSYYCSTYFHYKVDSHIELIRNDQGWVGKQESAW